MLIAGPEPDDRPDAHRRASCGPGEVLRFAARAGPGGKGLNVARGAQALGAPAALVAFLPGRTGSAVGAMIADEGIRLLGVAVRRARCARPR